MQAGVYHQRGRKLISYEEAINRADARREEHDSGVFWGLLRLPSSVATTHFSVVGATGSGKTLTLRFLLQSVLPHIGTGSDTRALV